MPRQDGTGPRGSGGLGGSRGRRGRGGRMSGSFGAGAADNCVCPNCGGQVAHVRGEPCSGKTCPQCGAKMTRE